MKKKQNQESNAQICGKATPQDKVDENIPVLPDDLLLMIFSDLTMDERTPLSTTCKRFRELDFGIGGKSFDNIKVTWTSDWHSVQLTEAKRDYSIRRDRTNPIEAGHINRLFRRAKTKKIEILILPFINYKGSIDNEPEIQKIISLLEMVPHQNFILSALIKNRNLEKAQIHLSLKSDGAGHSMHHTRQMLMQLPMMDKFKLTWAAHSPVKYENPDEQIFDDATLLHIATHTNHAELSMADCSAQGIIDVFEEFCKSQCTTKSVNFLALHSTIDQLFSVNTRFQVFDWSERQRGLYDVATRSLLYARTKDRFVAIAMNKLDQGGRRIYRRVEW